jgi:NTE family protein
VLTGAAARGAFQAGALAELLPALARDGIVPSIWVGTSAGAINAALWGSNAHLGAEQAAQELLEVWRRMSDDDVYRSLVPFTLKTAVQFAAGFFGTGHGTTSLLDTAPMAQTAEDLLDTHQLAENVTAGVLDAVGVVTSRVPTQAEATVAGAASGRSVLFLHEREASGYSGDPGRALDVARTPLNTKHVLASAAIPVAFSPVQVTTPDQATGWYVDGGVRLNAPLQPAIGLGATKILVVAATATSYSSPPGPDHSREGPDIADAAAEMLHAVLADRMIEDLRSLRRTNDFLRQALLVHPSDSTSGNAGQPYRPIEVLTVSPYPGELGALASTMYERTTRGLGRVTRMDNWLVGKFIRGAGDAAGRRELLSYLLFDKEYFSRSIELGRSAAAEALRTGFQT